MYIHQSAKEQHFSIKKSAEFMSRNWKETFCDSSILVRAIISNIIFVDRYWPYIGKNFARTTFCAFSRKTSTFFINKVLQGFQNDVVINKSERNFLKSKLFWYSQTPKKWEGLVLEAQLIFLLKKRVLYGSRLPSMYGLYPRVKNIQRTS